MENIDGIYLPKDRKKIKKFIPKLSKGIVVSVYDGDTFTIATNLPGYKYEAVKFSVRVAGIDCPEMRTKDESEKAVAQIAKNFVISQIMDKSVYLKDVKFDKYGRILAHVYLKDETTSLSEKLLRERLGVSYDGGTKQSPPNWLEYHYKK